MFRPVLVRLLLLPHRLLEVSLAQSQFFATALRRTGSPGIGAKDPEGRRLDADDHVRERGCGSVLVVSGV